MNRKVVAGCLLLLVGLAVPASAALKPGEVAPTFAARASLGGKTFDFDLRTALAHGPVVLYFYPAAFTPGCTLEAHNFAANIGAFKKYGATVIGVSHDSIATLNKFGVSECRSKFAVAADPDLKIARRYDSVLKLAPNLADRVSYVIARDGKIAYVYRALNPDKHVSNALAALKALAR
ncbi:MAG: peroxiredoxin [Candidatus Eremiobacteraeota bacterium]|nr:peroxiredoxin [Candidatus Eremiobacteraeota bacterium]